MADDFVSAKPQAWVQTMFGAATPFLLNRLGIVGVDYEPHELARLRALQPHRVLLTPNHPTNVEPALLFHLSRAVRQPFFFLASRESFDKGFGLWGQTIRRLGAFSVVRGTIDRASLKATRTLLAKPNAKLVIFPEGEVYGQNDTLLPFQSGAFQLAFWAWEDLHKAGKSEPIYIVPVALKYRFTHDMTHAVRASLTRLEKFTGATVTPNAPDYERLRRVGLAMLRSVENDYRLTPKSGDEENLTPRLNAVKEAILTRVAFAAGIANPKGDLPERMRTLLHTVGEIVEDEDDRSKETPYEQTLRKQRVERARPLLHDLRRLANWIAVYDGYVQAAPTPERMAETLARLERECWGKEHIGGLRRCRVRIGEPINLADYGDSYEQSKRTTVANLTRDVENRVAQLLGAVPLSAPATAES